jgi:hypothetical protein
MMSAQGGIKAPVLLMTYRKLDFLPFLRQCIFDYVPPKLYVAHNSAALYDDKAQVGRVRDAVLSWGLPCDVEYILRDQHLEISESFHQTLDYVFSKEECLIILEDDTLPDKSFFPYCNDMLSRFEKDESVGSIIGCNLAIAECSDKCFQVGFNPLYWGWASWASRWKQSRSVSLPWHRVKCGIEDLLPADDIFFSAFLQHLDASSITWDVMWGWAQALNRQRCIVPGVNLISNRGFSPEGTFTRFAQPGSGDFPVFSMLTLSPEVLNDPAFDKAFLRGCADIIQDILAGANVLQQYKLG